MVLKTKGMKLIFLFYCGVLEISRAVK